jgi:TctA family transporter
MEEIGNLFHGFATVLAFRDMNILGYTMSIPFNVILMVIGIVLGIIIGILPGLGGANGVAILLPLTFSMQPTSAIILLSCIYWGGAVRRRDHLNSVQYSGRAMVGRDDLRRLSDGATGPRR